MKDIKIITLNAHTHFASYTFDEVEETILMMNKKGYEFKGCVPTIIRGYGTIREIKIIFEKEM